MLSCCAGPNPVKDSKKLATLLLEHGANIQKGIPLRSYQLFQKFKKSLNWQKLWEGFQPIGNAALIHNCIKKTSDIHQRPLSAPILSGTNVSGCIYIKESPSPNTPSSSESASSTPQTPIPINRGRSFSGTHFKNRKKMLHRNSTESSPSAIDFASKSSSGSIERLQHAEFMNKMHIYSLDLAIACEDTELVETLIDLYVC
jgi:hypothetical protein